MLNLSKLAAGKEAYYLETVASGAEDYYLGSGEAPGYWTGAAAETLGLRGRVTAADLRRVLAGAHPATGEALTGGGRGRPRTVPGWDATFRAPKSVSLLWALGDLDTSRQVRRAHDRAVAQALGYLERNAAAVRRGGQQHPAGGFVAAAFRHRTSRAGDPLLHTHVLLANLGAADGDQGRWRALDGRTLYSHARTAGFVYQAVLRRELTAALGVNWKPVVNGYADIAGVARPLIDAFSSRRTEITALLGVLGSVSAKSAQMATLATRRAKTRRPAPDATVASPVSRDYGVEPASLREGWEDQAAQLGWTPADFQALLHTARPAALDGVLAADVAGGLLGADGLTSAASSFSRRDVVRGWAQQLRYGASAAELEALADAMLDQRAGAVRLTPTIDTAAVDQVVAAVCDTLALEADAAAEVRASVALAHAVGAALHHGTGPDVVAALASREIDSAADVAGVLVWRARQLTGAAAPSATRDGVIRRVDGTAVVAAPAEHRYSTPDLLAVEQRILDLADAGQTAGRAVADPAAVAAALEARPTLSDEQRHMVRRITGSGAAVDLVVGKAGTGKTYTLAAARQAWEASGTRVIGAAVAARAAQELTDGAGLPAFTVAKLLMDGPQSGLAPGSVLIVDEAAMVGTRQLERLLDLAHTAQAKVVLVGDHHQLPEIAAGGAFRGLLARLPAVELTVNRRQRNAWERDALDHLRSGSVPDALGAFRRAGRVTTLDTADAARAQLVTDWWAAAEPGKADPAGQGVMLAYRHDEIDDLNARARDLLRAAGRLGASIVTRTGREFAVGDAVACATNAPALKVTNGLRGHVVDIDAAQGGLVVQLRDGTRRPLPRSYLDEGGLRYRYATTGHAAQGMTADAVWVLGSDLLYREWAYIVFSRHRNHVQLYLTGTDELPDWVDHPEALQADQRTPLERLTHAATTSRAQQLATDQHASVTSTDDFALVDLGAHFAGALATARSDRRRTLEAAPDPEPFVLALTLLEAAPPAYLTDAIGPAPTSSSPGRLRTWRAAAAAVQEYRDRWGIEDPTDPLGQPPTHPAQRLAYDRAASVLHEAQQDLTAGPQQLDLNLAL